MSDPALATVLLLVLASFGAGLVDAIVGGGGLIQLPALVIAFPHAAPVHLLATNKLASICGTTTSAATTMTAVPAVMQTTMVIRENRFSL